jgi:hypothetical protein
MTKGTFLLLGGLAIATAAQAHHSTAMFDKRRTVELRGIVTDYQWTNPHTWIELDIRQPNGSKVHYSIEGGAVRTMEQQGWRARSLRRGDQVTVTVHPLRSGRPGGMLVSASLPDGRTLSYQPR